MKIKQTLIAAVMSLSIAVGLTAKADGAKSVAITAGDNMKFDVTEIQASPGQKVVVQLTNVGNVPKEAMWHNWILLKAGSDPVAYANIAMNAKADDYLPKSLANEVIVASPRLGPKESAKVSFTAPSVPGSYPFLCSCPGHCAAGMQGVLIVK